MFPGSPQPTSVPARTTRVRWDNIAIVLVGVVAATFAVVALVAGSGEPTAGTTPVDPAPKLETSAPSTEDPVSEELATTDGLTVEDSVALVEEARGFMAAARWDQAADRLATIPAEFRAAVDADGVAAELAERRGRYESLSTTLGEQVAGKRWADARTSLDSIEQIAVLTGDLVQTEQLVDAELALAVANAKERRRRAAAREAANDRAADEGDADTTGGGSTGTGTKPPVVTRPNSPKPTTKPATSPPLGDLLSPQEQAQLQAELERYVS